MDIMSEQKTTTNALTNAIQQILPIKMYDLMTTILAINVLHGCRNSSLRKKIQDLSEKDYKAMCKSLRALSKEEVMIFTKLTRKERQYINDWAENIITDKKLDTYTFKVPFKLWKIKRLIQKNNNIPKQDSFLYNLCQNIFEFDYIYGNQKGSKKYFSVNQATLKILNDMDNKSSPIEKKDIMKRLNDALYSSKLKNAPEEAYAQALYSVQADDFLQREFDTSKMALEILDNSQKNLPADNHKEHIKNLYVKGTDTLIENNLLITVKNNLYAAIVRKNLLLIEAITESCVKYKKNIGEIFNMGTTTQIYFVCQKLKNIISNSIDNTKKLFQRLYNEFAVAMKFSTLLNMIDQEPEAN